MSPVRDHWPDGGVPRGLGRGTGPLRGVRVVELASIGPGPHAAMTLADLGADVIRIERPEGTLAAMDRDKDVLTRGRPSVAMDLKDPRAAAVVLDLVEGADVLLEGMRPGAAERLGLGPEHCLARNPRLVYGRMTGWGQDGPLAPTAGHDIDYIAVSGVLHGLGEGRRATAGPAEPARRLRRRLGLPRHRRPRGPARGAVLRRGAGRRRLDRGRHRAPRGHARQPHRRGCLAGGARHEPARLRGAVLRRLRDLGRPAHGRGCHRAAVLRRAGDRLDLAEHAPDRDDPRNWPALREALAARFRERSQAEWAQVFEGSDACVAPVLPLTEAARHPHLVARHTYLERDGVLQPAPAPRFSRTPATLGTPPSVPGEHSRQALQAWGVDGVDRLIADGIVVEAGTG